MDATTKQSTQYWIKEAFLAGKDIIEVELRNNITGKPFRMGVIISDFENWMQENFHPQYADVNIYGMDLKEMELLFRLIRDYLNENLNLEIDEI